MLHLDPVEGKRTEESTPPLDLASYLNGCNVESIFTTDHEKINLKHIREQVAEHVEEPHKVENFVNALVDTDLATLIYGEDLRDDPAELKKVLDEEHITEGFEILDKVEALQTKYLLATRKTQLLKFNVWDLTEKIKLLESNIPLQEHQIQEPRDSEEGRDALVLSPLQSIYLRISMTKFERGSLRSSRTLHFLFGIRELCVSVCMGSRWTFGVVKRRSCNTTSGGLCKKCMLLGQRASARLPCGTSLWMSCSGRRPSWGCLVCLPRPS